MNLDQQIPQLPEEIMFEANDGQLRKDDFVVGPQVPTLPPIFPPLQFRLLQHGAYFLQWTPKDATSHRYNGTMRIERHGTSVTASGDLYHHHAFKYLFFPSFRLVPNPDPSPSAGIPIFNRSQYHCYLRVTQILEWVTTSNNFTLSFEKYDFDSSNNSWTNQGTHTANMKFLAAPGSYPSGTSYMSGELKSPAGVNLGTISMGRVSKFLRKATLEIDRVGSSEYPADNGDGLDWKAVFNAVDWDLRAYESDTSLSEPSGQSWSDAELHAAMLSRRDSADLDNEWRYHLLAVKQLDSTSRGIMYDAYAGDSNNIPREGAALSSHWKIPDQTEWGTVKGERFGAASAPYFRTAVHELGHALGLYHNTADNGFMNTTGTIAASPGTFPANVQWSFNAADTKRLKHMPDPWVRPGMIPFGNAYGTTPISPSDSVDLSGPLTLSVTPLLASVPIGAPVRVKVELHNNSDSPIEIPESLSLKSEHITGVISDASQSRRSFRSIFRCVEEHALNTLKPGASLAADMTLLRGLEGALFQSAGMHNVDILANWEIDGVSVSVGGSSSIMITPPVDEQHAVAARHTLSTPDLLLTLAIGGDHLDEGNAALDAAMNDKTLAPHYAVLQAKRLGRRFARRKANPGAALRCLGSDPVVSASEAEKIAVITSDASATALKSAPKKLAKTLKNASSSSRAVKKLVDCMSA